MPEPARTRWYEYVSQIGKYEYQRTHVYLGGSDVAGPARAYFLDPAFRTEILSKWVSPAYLAAYRPTMQGVDAAETRRADAMKAAEARRTESDARAADAAADAARNAPEAIAARQATEATRKAVAKDLETARRQHVDLSVLGIQLGEPLGLPPCPNAASDAPMMDAFFGSEVTATCAVSERSRANLMSLQMMFQATSLPWASTATIVRLAPSACPAWMDRMCAVFLNVKNNIPVGAFLNTRSFEVAATVSKALSKKYPHAAVKQGQRLQCQNSLTGVVTEDTHEHHWEVPGLYVSYSPLSSCPNTRVVTGFNTGSVVRNSPGGEVTIEIAHSRQQRDEAAAAKEAAGPSL